MHCIDWIPIFYSIAVYKALYKSFGGFAADVVAAIDQVKLINLHNSVNICSHFFSSKFELCITVSLDFTCFHFVGCTGRSRHHKLVDNSKQASSRHCHFL